MRPLQNRGECIENLEKSKKNDTREFPCFSPSHHYNPHMSRKKSTRSNPFFTFEMQNILAGSILVTLGALMFLSTAETSVIGKYFSSL
jgi:hypothetical protein